MRFFELGEEDEIIKKGLNTKEAIIRKEDFSDLQFLNTAPSILISSICPDVKNEFLNLNEQRARRNK